MYDFVLQLITFSSLAFIVYLLGRALPRVTDTEEAALRRGRLERLIDKIPLQKIDAYISTLSEKSLRRIKVLVLKFDNFLTHRLHRLKRNGSNLHGAEKTTSLFERKDEEEK